jgi:hypothetical protein
MAKPTPEQLAKINIKTLVPLTADETYTFPAKLVGDKVIPGRFYRMTPNFLRKMADQAKQGVSLLLDHSWANLGIMTIPIGRTYDSRLQQDGDELALYADHYMKMGQEIADISTDQVASGIDSGTIFDTSIGFRASKQTCSICGNNYYSSDCMHMRGRTYDEGKLCIVDIDDGDLMENSLVFDGAYPGAGVVGLNNTNTELQPTNYEVLSEDAKSLPSDGCVFYSFSSKSGFTGFVSKQQKNEEAKVLAEGDESMSDAQKAAETALLQAQAALGVSTGLIGSIRTTLGVTSDEGILAKITALSVQAAVGEQYKVKITEEACGAGVRAMGEAFNVEAMKLSLSNLPVAEIEKISASYEAQAKVVLGGGGQHTQSADVTLPVGALAGTAPANPNADGTTKTPEQLQALAKTEAREALTRTGHGHLMKEAK